MLAVFFLAGVIVSAALAYKGLVVGSLQFSKTTTLAGRGAKVAGMFCLTVAVLLLSAAVWAVWAMATQR